MRKVDVYISQGLGTLKTPAQAHNHSIYSHSLAMKFTTCFWLALTAVVPFAQSQNQPICNTDGSNFKLSSSQISSLNLPPYLVTSLEIAIRFERSRWATGSVFGPGNDFYTNLKSSKKSSPAGSVIKTMDSSFTTNYTIPPTLSLSHIVYQSKALNGSPVPVSAYILWPFNSRYGGTRAPLISWGHGTTGILPECAPSHIRDLSNQFSAPFALALAGFAVVATDYAGLGVPYNFDHQKPILHQFAASPAAGNDLLYAAQAAKAAFPNQLTSDFVVMGHSQGGGGAWAAAQQQLTAKVPGYLGAIALAPVTSAVDLSRAIGSSIGLLQLAKALPAAIPKVKTSDMLTDKGIKYFKLMEEIQGCNSASFTLLSTFLQDPANPLTKDSFLTSSAADQWNNLTVAGGKNYQGPMLVIQGTEDYTISPALTTSYVQKTCKNYSKNGLHYVTVNGVGHSQVLYASQQKWLAWIDQRFGKSNSYSSSGFNFKKCTTETMGTQTPRPLNTYNTDFTYYLQHALDYYVHA